MYPNPMTRRSSGLLLHPTSLPSGVLDDDVLRWLDFLNATGQSVWQMLPLGVPAIGLSPYQCLSAFAANPALLPNSFQRELNPADTDFLTWQESQSFWLQDYALFILLKKINSGNAWYQWSEPMRDRDPKLLENLIKTHAEPLQQIKWQQFLFQQCWQWLRTEANNRNISLFGDMPIFVAHDSADVWATRRNFLLDEQGQLLKVTGVPPDYFSETGQRWGNPHYDWSFMQATNFDWWLQRLQQHFDWFDLVRIDHFRGLQSVWMIDSDSETAEKGQWVNTPGAMLLETLQQKIGESLPLVAEDLGIITPEVIALRDKFNLPGMAVEQFSFDGFEDNPHKPHNISSNTVVYTGTHDNDTTAGWFNHLPEHEQQHVLHELGITQSEQLVDAMINRAMTSSANLSIIPMQDILQLDSDARMNIPGSHDPQNEHWQWQFDWSQINPEIISKLKDKTYHAKRC